MQEPHWKGKHYSFFQNKECEYFPCHQGIQEEQFNCLFCYCPLYVLGDKCGGNPVFLENGIKDCTHCTLPHNPENYGYVTGQFKRISEVMKKEPFLAGSCEGKTDDKQDASVDK